MEEARTNKNKKMALKIMEDLRNNKFVLPNLSNLERTLGKMPNAPRITQGKEVGPYKHTSVILQEVQDYLDSLGPPTGNPLRHDPIRDKWTEGRLRSEELQ